MESVSASRVTEETLPTGTDTDTGTPSSLDIWRRSIGSDRLPDALSEYIQVRNFVRIWDEIVPKRGNKRRGDRLDDLVLKT